VKGEMVNNPFKISVDRKKDIFRIEQQMLLIFAIAALIIGIVLEFIGCPAFVEGLITAFGLFLIREVRGASEKLFNEVRFGNERIYNEIRSGSEKISEQLERVVEKLSR
jgi:hypothetical protein